LFGLVIGISVFSVSLFFFGFLQSVHPHISDY
jgi:hypothetical protein